MNSLTYSSWKYPQPFITTLSPYSIQQLTVICTMEPKTITMSVLIGHHIGLAEVHAVK